LRHGAISLPQALVHASFSRKAAKYASAFGAANFMNDPNDVARIVVAAAFDIARDLGPGLMESVYRKILARDLVRRDLFVEQEKYVSFDYKGLWFDNGLKVDLLVNRIVVVELKSTLAFTPGDYKQVLTYLRLMQLKLGLLINFGAPTLKQGIRRVVNGL
jgi:GxxExxY protein